MTLDQIIAEVNLLATAAAPALPPNAQLAINLAQTALQAVDQAQTAGVDITDEQLVTIFDQDAKAKADDLAAQQKIEGGN